MMKVCAHCQIEKDESFFGHKCDKRRNPPLHYLDNVCNECRAARQRERTRKERQTPEGRAKHNFWTNESHKRNREKNLAKMKERRATPEYKAYMKAYRERRKEIIYQQELITKRKYFDKNRDSVSDEYCIQKIKEQQKITRENITAEMIERKRIQILIKRLRNNIAKIKKDEKYNNS